MTFGKDFKRKMVEKEELKVMVHVIGKDFKRKMVEKEERKVIVHVIGKVLNFN